jgi:predicted alpha/beta hydrolase family esterase
MENPKINVLPMKMQKEKRPTLFFSSKNKKIVEYENAKKLFTKIESVKIIFEIDGLVIDIKKKRITTKRHLDGKE